MAAAVAAAPAHPSPSAVAFVLRGATLVHSRGLHEPLEVIPHAVVAVDSAGRIAYVGDSPPASIFSPPANAAAAKVRVYELPSSQLLVPGLVDTHTHASQYGFAGTGRLPLLQWLETYTFPTEARFRDTAYAARLYELAVRRHARNGTTTCCYYGTIHLEATLVLYETMRRVGQRGFVGKVCMDRNSPANYVETCEESVRATCEFVARAAADGQELVRPIVTPRFAPTCSGKLLTELGRVAAEHKLPIQTHVSENVDEVAWVRELFPERKHYTDVYDHHGLLTDRSIMGHAIYLSPEERALFRERGAAVSHCANSNFSLHSGVLDVRQLLDEGVKVGLGTDVAGGSSPSMLDAMRQALVASSTVKTTKYKDDATYKPLTYEEAFYLATLGGAEAVGLRDTIGNFEVGKAFDALVVDPNAEGSPFDITEHDTPRDVFQKFVFLGDDRNIAAVYVDGKKLEDL